MAYETQVQQLAPRFFAALAQSDVPYFWFIGEILAKLPPQHLSGLERFLSDEDEAVHTGAAIFWKTIVDTIINTPELLLGRFHGHIRFTPELMASLLKDENRLRRLAGISLIELAGYPIEDVQYRQTLLAVLQQPLNADEEMEQAELLKKVPILDTSREAWLSLLEEILSNPQTYSDSFLAAAMGRYQSITGSFAAVLSETDERA